MVDKYSDALGFISTRIKGNIDNVIVDVTPRFELNLDFMRLIKVRLGGDFFVQV